MAEEVKVPTRSSVISILKKGLGFPDLTTNQLRTKVASLSQTAVKGAIRKSGLKGAALMAAFDVAMKFAPEPKRTSQGIDPLNLFGPKRKDKVDKAAVEAAVKEANEAMDSASKLAPDQSQRPVTRDKKKKSEDKPLRPVTRKDVDVKNMMYGGMAKAKPRTGNTDYRKGGMFTKNGKK